MELNETLATRANAICAVVVTYNRLDVLKETIEALSLQTRPVDKILVVNNGSTDGTAAWLAAQAEIIVITQTNLGGAGGFYTGLKRAYENGFGWMWCMDDDVAPRESALEAMTNAPVFTTDVGFITGRVIAPSGDPLNVPALDSRPGTNGASDWLKYLSVGIAPVRTAAFVSVLMPRESVQQVGYPIKEMFIWGDDTEYTYRLSNVRKCYVVGASVVIHKRASAQHLSVAREANKARIPMYAYLFQNNLYWMLRERAVRHLCFFTTEVLKELLASLHRPSPWLRISTIFSGLIRGLRFNPPIEIPK